MVGTLVAHSRESDFFIEVLPDEEPALEEKVDTDELESLIVARTHNTIRSLRVTVRDGCVTITGWTRRYYNKQLASQAIMEEDYLVMNSIEVI